MVHQSRHLARSCGVFFYCDFPGYCGQMHHRGREQGVSVAFRTDRQQSPSGALLARGRVPGEMNGRYRLTGESRAVFLLRFPETLRTGAPSGTRTACCGGDRRLRREQGTGAGAAVAENKPRQGAPFDAVTASRDPAFSVPRGKKRPSGAFLGRGRVPGELSGSSGLTGAGQNR